MKRLFLFAAALLCVSAPAFSEDGDIVIDLEAVGRIESNPQFTLGRNSEASHNFANSCLYTNLEMTFGEHWFVNIVNHWLDTGGENKPFANTSSLYKNTWRSANNWVDFLYVDYMTGGWTFRLGKDCQAIAGWEYEAWDWNVVYDMATTFWMENSSYRWGGSVLWTSESESTTLQLQALSGVNFSDQVWKPWHKGYGQYTFKHSGEYGAFITSNAISWRQMGPGFGSFTAGVGGGGHINERLTLRAEATGEIGTGKISRNGHNLKSIVEVLWAPSEKWDVHFKAAVERFGFDNTVEDPSSGATLDTSNAVNMGGTVSFYPLRNSRDLRLMGTVSYNDFIFTGDEPSQPRMGLTIGVIYDHVFHLKK